MLEVRTLSEFEYTEFLASSSRYFYTQDVAFVQMRSQELGSKYQIFGLVDNNRVIIASPILYYPIKKFFYQAKLLFGPVVLSGYEAQIPLFMELLVKILRKQPRVLQLELTSAHPRNYYQGGELVGADPVAEEIHQGLLEVGFQYMDVDFFKQIYSSYQSAFFYVRDIRNLTYDTFLSSISSNARRRVKQSEKFLDIRRATSEEDISIFQQLCHHAMEASGQSFQPYPHYFRQLMDTYGEDCWVVIVSLEVESALSYLRSLADSPRNQKVIDQILEYQARGIERIDLSTGLFLFCGGEVYYISGGSDKNFTSLGVAYFLHAQVFQEAIARSYHHYNFFYSSGNVSEEAVDYGVYRFKSNFHGNLEEYLGTYRYQLSFLASWFIK